MSAQCCNRCGKSATVYAVVRWADLVAWCSQECWIEDEKAAHAKEAAHRQFLVTGVKYFDPTGK